MCKQYYINKYFKKLCNTKFFQNDGEAIIGRAKDVIIDLQEQIKFVKDPENNIDEETINDVDIEAQSLINKIREKHKNQNDVVGIYVHPMATFYMLGEIDDLYKELKEYYEEMEENTNEN